MIRLALALAALMTAAVLMASCAQAPQSQGSAQVNALGKPATVDCNEGCVVVPVPVWLEIIKRLHGASA